MILLRLHQEKTTLNIHLFIIARSLSLFLTLTLTISRKVLPSAQFTKLLKVLKEAVGILYSGY